MTLKDIESKLKEIDPKVFYGIAPATLGETPDVFKKMAWNYIVFNRVKPAWSQNKTSKSIYYDVHIIRENYVPEDIEDVVVQKMCEIDGMRLTSEDGAYNYTQKPNTDTVVEALTLHFVRARK